MERFSQEQRMSWQEDALKRLDELIKDGESVRFDATAQGWARLHGWNTQAIVALEQIVGSDHAYTRALIRASADLSSTYDILEILSRLRSDLQKGYLRKAADIISGEVFADFLEIAQHLLDQSYKDPAASLCGAVLEDGLRRIARNHGIQVSDRDDLTSLRDKCAQKGVFNNLVRQQITAWTTLRNSADHGKFSEYTAQQVGSMISDVRSLLATRLG
jgi:hypothetical protein